MKRFLAILLMLQLLSNQEALAEVAKLPFLFHHYSETEHEHGFLDFLKEHYVDSHHHGKDHEHGKLPFKHSDDGNTHHAIPISGYETKTEHSIDIVAPESSAHKYLITNESNFPSFSNNIWQPPK
ncbi:MAG: hypothetical protein ACXVO9_03085 [Bacteroidia bacterium]